MSYEVLLLGLLVGVANYCFRYLPLRLRVGNARPTKRGAVGILLDTIGIASICALLVVSTAPEVMHDTRRFVPTLVGFAVLVTLESQENHSIQPSELSCALGSSRTNATRIADELEKRGWIERRESDNDRRCLHLQLTEKGHEFLREVLPPQHNCLHQLWSALSTTEKDQLEQITRKLLSRLDQMEQDGVVLEAMS